MAELEHRQIECPDSLLSPDLEAVGLVPCLQILHVGEFLLVGEGLGLVLVLVERLRQAGEWVDAGSNDLMASSAILWTEFSRRSSSSSDHGLATGGGAGELESKEEVMDMGSVFFIVPVAVEIGKVDGFGST